MCRVTLAVIAISCFACLAGTAVGADYSGRKVLHIDSYHQGNEWNDRIAAAVREVLEPVGVELKVFHMDTKRNKSEAFKKAAALEAKQAIEAFAPDVVTASDDNASKFLIMPYYRDAELPFVFCGLNWDASVYGMPYSNVTGMVEVSPIPQIVRLLRRYAKGQRIGYLAEDTLTKRKELEHHRRLFDIEYERTYLVKSFAEWKQSYLRAQEEVDMLIILGHAAVTDWDDQAAQRLAEQHTRIPSGTDFAWLMHFTMLGVGKLPEEQGRWAAHAALRILDGVPPSRIPLAYNKDGKLYFNTRIGARMGITDPPALAELVP